MAKFEGFKRIIKEDFAPKDQPMIEKLAFPINSAMEFLARAVNKDITFSDNINCQIKEIDVTVTNAGVPKQPTSFKSDLKTISRGFVIVDVVPLESELSGVITGVTAGSSTLITCANHRLSTGDEIIIANSLCTPSIDGKWKVFRVSNSVFSIPAYTLTSASGGAFTRSNSPESLPFVEFSEENKQITLTKILGLKPNIKYRLTLISIG